MLIHRSHHYQAPLAHCMYKIRIYIVTARAIVQIWLVSNNACSFTYDVANQVVSENSRTSGCLRFTKLVI